jgi:intein/homing endonuclease
LNGQLEVTGSHPFRVGANWINVEDLQIGDELTDSAGNLIVVASLERVDKGVRVYNIEVGNTHTFFVDGTLVHNKIPDPHQG